MKNKTKWNGKWKPTIGICACCGKKFKKLVPVTQYCSIECKYNGYFERYKERQLKHLEERLMVVEESKAAILQQMKELEVRCEIHKAK